MTPRDTMTLDDALLGGPGFDGYAYDADVYCRECGQQTIRDVFADYPDGMDADDARDSETLPQPIFFGEADGPEHCADCGEYLYGPQYQWSDGSYNYEPEPEPEPDPVYRLRFVAYCGMTIPLEDKVDEETARDRAASYLRYLHRKGHQTVTLRKGEEWESLERDDAMMVPDTAGTLVLSEVTP